MSSWARDPEGAADALILRSLDDIAVAGRGLLVNQRVAVPAAVRARGADGVVWNRRLQPGLPAAPWPAPGPFDLAVVRLPKAREEQAMTAHAAMSVLRPGGRLILYGGNDEGIRSAAGMLAEIGDDVTTLAARGHGRVLATHRPQDPTRDRTGLRASLAEWRSLSSIDLAGAARAWVSYPGCFAAGRLDEGSALLLSALPPLAAGARVLDYGCGTGAIAAAALARQPALQMHALDSDAVALEAARENVPGARLHLGTGLADAGRRDYDAILSNPPLHQGIAEDRGLVEQLISEAPSYLAPHGCLQVVVQGRIMLDQLLARHFAQVACVAQTARYRVWRASPAPARPV